MYSSVQGCITSASKYVGGIVGQSNALVMNNYAEIVINSTTTSAGVGGIVGYNCASIGNDTVSATSKSCVINNYAIARITAGQDSSCGAIIGSNVNTDNSSAIVLNPTTEIEKKYNRIYGNYYLSANGDVVNGVGNIIDNSNAYITTVLTENQMKKYATANDLSKLNTEGAIIDKTHGYVTYNAKGEYVVWDFEKTWGLGVEFNSGFPYIKSNAVAKNEAIFNGISSSPDTPIDPTPDDPDEPKPTGAMTQAEFRALFEADLEANDGKQYTGSYLISRDVILTEAWVPIGTPEQPFNGKFIMAKGAVIHNLYIVDCGLKYYGLFGYVGAKASINGVSIEGVKIELDDSAEEDVVVGALAGYSEAKYINGVMFSVLTAVNNKTYITASSENGFDKIAVSNKKSAVIGGVIGELADNKFAYDLHCSIGISAKNCNKNVVIGGVVGSNNGYIEMCSYDGNLNNSNSYNYVIEIMESSGATMYVGGVVGDNNFTISASKAMGKIVVPTADNVYVGGIAGYSKGSIEKSSASLMQINGGYYVGGIVGVVETNELLVGKGSVADFEGITQSWASGTLTGKRVGGLAGKVICGTISNCYTTVNVSGEKMAGFVVDLPRKSDTNCGKVKYCYSATTFNTSAGEAYWESASVIRQTNGWWAGNSKLAGYVENCIYNTHDNLAEESKKIDSIKRQYSYYILNQGMDCDDGRNSDENCKKVSTFTARGSGFDTSIWNLSDGSYPTLFNAK